MNSLEQLCINFANEHLQHFFNQTVIAQEEVNGAHASRGKAAHTEGAEEASAGEHLLVGKQETE